MATTKAQQNAVNKYMKNNYDSLRVVVPKGRKKDIAARAEQRDLSINGLINYLIRQELGITDKEWKGQE